MKTTFLPLFRTQEVAANSVPKYGDDDLVGIGANERPLVPEDPWQLVAPYGKFPHPKGLQIFGQEQAHKIVKAYNSLRGRMGRAFRGLPIFVGHPDLDRKEWPDTKRYGKVDGLEVREDGLYCKPAWNEAGLENEQQGYHVYPSPLWAFRRTPHGIEPMELLSIGMTNFPNIKQSAPWSANERTLQTPCKPTRIPQLVAWHHSRNPYAALYGDNR